jgi:hypothetical protein
MEEWKDINGFEGLYQVSNLGNVRRYYAYKKTYRILKPVLRNGYHAVSLSKNDKSKSFRVNRLVAIQHLENPKNYPIVMHLDNDVTNNSIENLQWGNQSMNIKQAVKEGRWNNQWTI